MGTSENANGVKINKCGRVSHSRIRVHCLTKCGRLKLNPPSPDRHLIFGLLDASCIKWYMERPHLQTVWVYLKS